MTEEQTDILIAKMLEAPATLTAKELEAIMCDAELRDIYNVSAAVSNACIRQPEIDTASEWRRFSQRLTPRRHKAWRKFMMAASVVIALLTTSAIIYTALHHSHLDSNTSLIARAEQPAPATPPDTPCDDTKDFTDTEIEEIPETKAVGSEMRAMIRQTDEVDIDEYLRLQQARVDNELALQNAEMFKIEYNELMEALASNGADITVIQEDLNRLTMQ